MELRPLGRTGVSVSKLCLGAMMFGAWAEADHDKSIRIVHAALDAGINFIDTADVYSAGESEEILGKALAGGKRDDVVLATKVGWAADDDPNHRGRSRRWIVQQVENSLRRLGTDWIDLYQLHRPDPNTDVEETLAALTDLVQRGKVRYTPWHRSRRPGGGSPTATTSRCRRHQRKLQATEQLAQLSEETRRDAHPTRAGFVLDHPAVTAPIIGPRTIEHLESQLAAADVVLDAAVLDRIDEIVPPGNTLNPADTSYGAVVLQPAARRR